MIRKNKTFKADAIITGDWHLRDSIPKCRTDDFINAQWFKIQEIKELQRKHDCPILFSGDLFHTWKSTPFLINETISEFIGFNNDFISVIGNHDMKGHNIDLMQQSAWQTLFATGYIEHLSNHGDWDMDHMRKNTLYKTIKNRKIKILHIMTFKGKKPWPDCQDKEGNKLFKMFPKADLIVTGHNHQSFTIEKNDKLLINPGCLTRQTAKEIDHKPCVFLWNAETNMAKPHYLKIKKDVISMEHIQIQKHKEVRALAFIKKLKDSWDIGLSFEDNIEKAFQENKIPNKMKQIIYNWMGV